MKQMLIRFGFLFVLAGLGACGQKGALILPEQVQEPVANKKTIEPEQASTPQKDK